MEFPAGVTNRATAFRARKEHVMVRTCKLLGLGVLFLVTSFASLPQPEAQPAKDFKADDVVQTLSVKLDVGADGDDLAEPVALDLGLGFPLWLEPVGRKEGEIAPFGAVAQQSTAKDKVAAGSSVTFTFGVAEEAGQDAFQTTKQLMAGVRVSDIARIGFASAGSSNWQLAGYEINING